MCLQPAAPARKPTAPKARVCQWIYSREQTLELFANNLPAPLLVTANGVERTYWAAMDGAGRWSMWYAGAENDGCGSYEVDVENATCSCPHFVHKRTCSKHVPALRAALKWLEVAS
jgi:hypothetical protein